MIQVIYYISCSHKGVNTHSVKLAAGNLRIAKSILRVLVSLQLDKDLLKQPRELGTVLVACSQIVELRIPRTFQLCLHAPDYDLFPNESQDDKLAKSGGFFDLKKVLYNTPYCTYS